MFYLLEVNNVIVEGCGNIIGDNAGHVPFNPEVDGYGEWGFGIVVRKCSNIIIRNLTLSRQWGDGLIIKGIPADTYVNTNILVDNVTIYKNRRNGMAVGAATGCSILNCLFDGNGTDEVRGTLPRAGIDFEADNIDSFEKGNINVVMDNCKFQNNFYSISSTVSQLKDYGKAGTIISNCIFDASLRLNEMHWITFENCYIPSITTTWGSTWGNSNGIIFNNCIFGEIDPYQVASAFEYGNAFNNCILPQANEIKRQLYVNLGVGRTIKLTLPNLNGNVSFSAYTYGAGASSATPVYAKWNFFFGNSATRRLKNVEAIIPNTSTLAAATYKWLPVFSNLYYNSATSRYELYFTIGGNVETPATPTTTVVTGVIHVEGEGRFVNAQMSWLDITKEYIDTIDIPSYVTWPQKEIFDNSYDGDLPVLDVTEVGRRIYSLTSKRPLYWDNTTSQFRDSEGLPNLTHRGFEVDMTAVAAQLTASERGYRFFLRNTQSTLYWDGTEFVNEDGSLYSTTRIIKGKDDLLTWEEILGFQNKTYKIVSDIDLNGATLTLPSGCTLDFQGGSFSNGTIVFNDTIIKSSYKCFKKTIRFSGNLSPQLVKSSWFEFDSADCIDSLLDIFNISEGCTIHLEEGIYNVSAKYVVDNDFPEGEENGIIKIKSNSKIILDGIVNLLPNSLRHYSIFLIRDKSNVIIEGKGRIIGDVETHTGTTGEWGHGIQISSSKNIVVRDITVSKCWGDGISISSVSTTYLSKDVTIDNIVSTYNRRLGVSIISGDNIRFLNSTTELNGSINGTSPKRGLDIEPDPNSFLNNVLVDNCIIKDQGLCYIPTSGVVSDQDYKIIIQNCNITSQFNICGPCTFKGNRIRFLFITNCRYVEIMNNHIYENLIFAGNSETPVAKTKIIGNNITPLASLAHNAAIVFNDADTTLDEVIFVDNIIDLTKKDEVLLQKGVPGSGTLNIERCSIFGIKTQQQIFWTAGNVLNSLINTNCININHLYNIEDSKVMFAGNTILHTSATPFIIREDINTKYTIEIINNNFIPMSDILLGDLVNYVGHTFAGTIKILGNNFLGNDSSLVGTYSKSPTLTSTQTGRIYYVTDVKIPTFWDGTSWRDANGYPALKKIGTTAERPPISSGSYPGYIYYDTTLKKYICWNGTEWVNMDGTSLS